MIAHSKRSAIVEDGLDLVHRAGFANSGVAAIAAAAGAPKGSFYNHFESKDAFGIAILDRYFENVRATLGAILADRAEPATARIRRYFLLLRDIGSRDGFARGCLIGNLSAEVASVNELLGQHLRLLLAEWTSILAAAVEEAQHTGVARADVSAQSLAAILLDAWQGALLRAKVEHTPAALDAVLDVLLPTLLRPARP
jgi:TetR/AcrR family transcriptional regulator, transcriptional repressor for nem operon